MNKHVMKHAVVVAKTNIVLSDIFGKFSGKVIEVTEFDIEGVGLLRDVKKEDPVFKEMKNESQKFNLHLDVLLPEDNRTHLEGKNNRVLVRLEQGTDKLWRVPSEFVLI